MQDEKRRVIRDLSRINADTTRLLELQGEIDNHVRVIDDDAFQPESKVSLISALGEKQREEADRKAEVNYTTTSARIAQELRWKRLCELKYTKLEELGKLKPFGEAGKFYLRNLKEMYGDLEHLDAEIVRETASKAERERRAAAARV